MLSGSFTKVAESLIKYWNLKGFILLHTCQCISQMLKMKEELSSFRDAFAALELEPAPVCPFTGAVSPLINIGHGECAASSSASVERVISHSFTQLRGNPLG